MSDNLWNLDETNAGEQRVLSKKEREFLMTGDSGTYTTAEMERRVASKAEMLPGRFQQLVDDICLLYNQGYVGPESNPEIWEHLLSLTNRSQKVRGSPIVPPTESELHGGVDFGFEIGSLLRMLQDEPVSSDLVWGMIIGLVGESSEEWEREAGNLVELFEELNGKYEWRLFTAGAEAYEDDGFTEERDEIREILQQQGFAPAPSLVNAVLLEYTRSDSSARFDDENKSWEADPSQSDHPTPPEEMPSAVEMRRTRFETLVKDFDDRTRLQEVDRLAKDLKEDAIQIQRRQWRGVDPDQAFRFIGRNGETQIQEFEQTELKGQNNMTTTLRNLSYDDSSWVNQPVVEENRGENSYWELTPYGKLLHTVRVERNYSTNWIYDFIVDPQGLDERFNQLISEVL